MEKRARKTTKDDEVDSKKRKKHAEVSISGGKILKIKSIQDVNSRSRRERLVTQSQEVHFWNSSIVWIHELRNSKKIYNQPLDFISGAAIILKFIGQVKPATFLKELTDFFFFFFLMIA